MPAEDEDPKLEIQSRSVLERPRRQEIQAYCLVKSRTVDATGFVVVDDRGEPQAQFELAGHSPRIAFYDRLEKERLRVGHRPAGTPDVWGHKGGMRGFCLVLFVASLLSGPAVSADTVLPSHKCMAPLKQREFATQFQLERYKSVVELYRSCLDAFVREQEKAIEIHRQAIQIAIDDWNKFVGEQTKEPSKAQEGKEGGQEFRDKP